MCGLVRDSEGNYVMLKTSVSTGDVTKNAWSGRFRQERERLWPKRQEQAAEVLGLRREVLSRYESGKVLPGLEVLLRLDGAGIDVLYVLTGRRENAGAKAAIPQPVNPDTAQPRAAEAGGLLPVAGAVQIAPADTSVSRPLVLPVVFAGETRREYSVIPRIRAAASAGRADDERRVSAADMAADPAGVMALDQAYMRAEFGRTAGYATVAVQGDSMERTLLNGEMIVIDTLVTAVTASGIYVVAAARNVLVKRITLKMDGGVVVKSDNPAYADSDVAFAADELDQLTVLGRMVWPRMR